MKRVLINLALISTIGLVGCSSNTQSQNTGAGAVSGGAIGGLGLAALGGNPVAIGAGVIGGALIGGFIGHNMDSTDTQASVAAIKGNPVNHTTQWVNPKTGVTYTMTPTSDLFTLKGNPNCRKYNFTATTKQGKTHQYNGTACLMEDNNWHNVKR
ncbi:MAG: hypothetical protein K0S63_930 [Gammaproteobacteria bacterium]|jgi:surface antigen|nr:hypothetical protein [Gammaproteobacteria bacterium]